MRREPRHGGPGRRSKARQWSVPAVHPYRHAVATGPRRSPWPLPLHTARTRTEPWPGTQGTTSYVWRATGRISCLEHRETAQWRSAVGRAIGLRPLMPRSQAGSGRRLNVDWAHCLAIGASCAGQSHPGPAATGLPPPGSSPHPAPATAFRLIGNTNQPHTISWDTTNHAST